MPQQRVARQPRGGSADLELHAAEPHRLVAGDLVRDRAQRLSVVPADRDHGHLVGEAAPEPPQRLLERLADGVPDRGIRRGESDEAQPPVAEDVICSGVRRLPALCCAEGVHPDEARTDLIDDDVVDLVESGELVTDVRLPDNAVARSQLDDERGAMGHRVVAAFELAGKRSHDRDRVYPRDDQPAARRVVGLNGRLHGLVHSHPLTVELETFLKHNDREPCVQVRRSRLTVIPVLIPYIAERVTHQDA